MLISFIVATGIEVKCPYSGCVSFRPGTIESSGRRQRVVEEQKRSCKVRYNQQALQPCTVYKASLGNIAGERY